MSNHPKNKSNNNEEPTYLKPQDNKIYIYVRKSILLCPVPYVWVMSDVSINQYKKNETHNSDKRQR